MFTAYQIPIPEIKPFVTVILILLWVAAASALLLLPAIFVTLEKLGIGVVGGPSAMSRRLGLGKMKADDPDVWRRFSSTIRATKKRGEAKQRDKTCIPTNKHGQVLVDEVGTRRLSLRTTRRRWEDPLGRCSQLSSKEHDA